MDKLNFTDNKTLIIAGIATVTTFLTGAYFITKYFKKPKTNQWIDDYFTEIAEKIEKHNQTNPKSDTLPSEILVNIYQLMQELQSYYMNLYNSDLEAERIEALSNKEEYEALIFETMEAQDKHFQSATKLLESRLNISQEEIQTQLSKADRTNFTKLIHNDQKPYENIPEITTNELKKAFKFYVEYVKLQTASAQKQIAEAQKNPEYREAAMKIIYINKFVLQDTLKKKFNMEEKYFNQLLREHDLLGDREVKEGLMHLNGLETGFL